MYFAVITWTVLYCIVCGAAAVVQVWGRALCPGSSSTGWGWGAEGQQWAAHLGSGLWVGTLQFVQLWTDQPLLCSRACFCSQICLEGTGVYSLCRYHIETLHFGIFSTYYFSITLLSLHLRFLISHKLEEDSFYSAVTFLSTLLPQAHVTTVLQWDVICAHSWSGYLR